MPGPAPREDGAPPEVPTVEATELDMLEEDKGDEWYRDRIRVLSGSTETAASFQFDKEDHTLGNALRYVIMKNPDVEFCGYSIPHPSEEKLNIRIQTYDGVSVYTILEKGLKDLEDLCDVVTEKFTEAREQFKADQMEVS